MPFQRPASFTPGPPCPQCKSASTVLTVIRFGAERWYFCPECEYSWVVAKKGQAEQT